MVCEKNIISAFVKYKNCCYLWMKKIKKNLLSLKDEFERVSLNAITNNSFYK